MSQVTTRQEPMQYLTDAADAVAAERERIGAERAALQEFEARIAALDPATSAAATAGGQAGVVAVQSRSDGVLRTVRRQYRETVIAAREETAPDTADRSLAEHMTADFGQETALAVTTGGGLTPHLKQSLLHASRHARSTREGYANTLSDEADAIKSLRTLSRDIDGTIAAVESTPMIHHSYDDLFDRYVRLTQAEDRLDAVLEERQAALHRPANGASADDLADVRSHLYHDIDPMHPLLAHGAALARSVRRARERVSEALSRRV